MKRIELVGHSFQVSGKDSRSAAGFAAHFGNDDPIYICDGVANFRLNAFEQVFQAAAKSLVRIVV
jgi:hypothetical protein